MEANKKEQSFKNCPKEKLDAKKIKSGNLAAANIICSKIRVKH